jgi:hypothetical protein
MRSLRVLLFPLLALLTLLFASGCPHEENEAIPNVRLGMSPRDVRERFRPGGEGTWQTALGTGDDTVLEWNARGAGPVAHARFEFHLGMLVAIRATTTERVARDEVSATPKTVTAKKSAPEGGTSVTVLARDCPTHKEEAESLASKAP